MGAQAYEEQIWTGARGALASIGTGTWRARRLIVRSVRSPLIGNRRLPMGVLIAAGPQERRIVGRALYAGDTVSHRMNLELPPAPHGDVATLHDIVAWRFPDESPLVPAAREELRQADVVICVSEFTAQEAVDCLGLQNVRVIPNGVDARYFDATPLGDAARDALGLPQRYVLHLGGSAMRKNLEGLAEAWPRVQRERPGLTLVLAGPPHPRRTALFDRLPSTTLTGRLPDAVMPAVVAGAETVVIPSLYEGFGLPVLEAMAARVPVVAAATSSLPEVAGGHAILTGISGPEIAQGLLTATSGDTGLRQVIVDARAHAERYTWERSAREHARVWASLG
jgi:glycosyltransferase involved in cell wall biosynthesis